MPVSVLTDVVTWAEMILQIGVTTVELGVLTYLVFFDGWLDMLRLISFYLDKLIIKYVDKFYSYFDKILGGTLFTPEVVDRVMGNAYLLVALFVLFKLVMLLMKYITNPDMVHDEKIGAASLVKRVIIGMALMFFLPNIFNIGIDLQKAILSDNLFGQILMEKRDIRTYEKNKNKIGRILAFNVYQAFWNMDKSQVTDSKLKKAYEESIKAYDPGVFGSINEKSGGDFAIDYFPIASTAVLLYVLYLIIKYCIDIVVRMFKLFVLQLLGPLAITDYMVNGDSKDMFKSWTKTTLAAYAMLFMRVFCIWFVAFVTTLMNKQCTEVENGICKDSLLYTPATGSPDYLLRALITLGLLAFLMDLPKLLSDIFGLDLEQDASVKGLMNKVGGAAKMVGMGAVAAGGAAVGGFIGTAKAGLQGAKQGHQLKKALKDGKITGEQYQKARLANMKNTTKNMSAASGGALKGVGVAAAGMVPGGRETAQSLSQGYNSAGQNVEQSKRKRAAGDEMKNKIDGMEQQNKEAQEKEEQKNQMAQMNAAMQTSVGQQAAMNHKLDSVVDNKQQVNTTRDVNTRTNANSTYADGTARPDMAQNEFGRNTTFRANRGQETGMQQRVNDAAHVHDAKTEIERAAYLENSAFANISDDAFREYQAANGVEVEGRKYDDGTLVPDMASDEFGRNTTYRADRSSETGMQQRVNDAAHVHDAKSGTELADYVENSAFANVSDDAFRAYQEAGGVKEAAPLQDNIGGVNVSAPAKGTGERKTDSGLIIPGGVSTDKK